MGHKHPMDILFAFAAGLLTLINPCVLPVLPIVLASALQADKRGPLALALGMSLSFVILGLGVATLGYALGITQDVVTKISAIAMVGFGLVLLVPQFGARFSTAMAGLSAGANAQMDQVQNTGLQGQFIGGIILGAVWSPCVGPTLGGAISLAWQGSNLMWSGLIMLAFAAGFSTILLLLAYGARTALKRRQALMRRIAEISRPLLGATFILIGLGLFFQVNHMIEAWLIHLMPAWLIDLSVSL